MLAWKSHRSPLREHFSFQANMAAFLLSTIQRADARASARLRVVRCGSKRARRSPMFTWMIPSDTAKGALQFPGQHGDVFQCGQYSARACALYVAAVNGQ
eukprot:2156349-Pyramimonas_sp.AAC.1